MTFPFETKLLTFDDARSVIGCSSLSEGKRPEVDQIGSCTYNTMCVAFFYIMSRSALLRLVR